MQGLQFSTYQRKNVHYQLDRIVQLVLTQLYRSNLYDLTHREETLSWFTFCSVRANQTNPDYNNYSLLLHGVIETIAELLLAITHFSTLM